MQTVRRNKRPMKYALYLGNVQVAQTDSDGNPQYFINSEGEITYMVTGEKKELFSTPIDFGANISMSGGEAEAMEYGLSTSDYDAIALLKKGSVPLVEGALVWHKSEVKYEEDSEKYVSDDLHELIEIQTPIRTSADYMVVKISDSQNYTRVILKAINK